ncbi:MAG: protein kinase, partial [Acidobacteria bacterium]|nr:protein kinase [Acidobacteriota bacterium]
GGMGEVYRAHDERLDRDVAVKVLPEEVAEDPERLARFEREAKAVAALSHSGILEIFDFDRENSVTFAVTELLEGETLAEIIRKSRHPLPWKQVQEIGSAVADGLSAAHDKGVVHRDIKPSNIFVCSDGRVKILDFGLAATRGVVDDEAETGSIEAPLTAEGKVMGTVAYMSPEQLRGLPANPHSDIWALGVVLHEMASGSRPFKGNTGFELSSAILNKTPPPLPVGPDGVQPTQLQAIIDRCLEKDPSRRYQSAGEVRAALETAQSGGVVSGPAPSTSARMRRCWPVATFVVVAAIMAVLAVFDVAGVRRLLLGRGGGQPQAVRMAVLPFANLSGDPEQEYLSDGFTQEMITQLGRLHPEGLSVIARSSVMRYKKGDTPIDQIGSELEVDYVLEGSTHREADRIRINAVLIQVGDQTQLWADTYERELAGILAVQSEVAQRVATALALELLPAEQARLTSARSVNPEAHDAYLKGSHHRQMLTSEGLDTAERYFELALENDPEYAPAYEGLARVWNSRRQMGIVPRDEGGPKAKAAALQSISLDEGSAGAHAVMAAVKTWTDWDWAGAETEWRRALELDPNRAYTHASYAFFLAITGRPSEAIRHSERALELDPFNAYFHGLHATTLYFNRRYDDALAAVRKAFAIQPNQGFARNALQYVYICKGMRDEWLADQREQIAHDPERVAAFERGLAEGGHEGAQRAIADLLAARHEASGGVIRPGLAHNVALSYLDAGDHDLAIDWLEKAYEERDPAMPFLTMPLWDPLRSNPRFQDILRRMNLPLG